MQDAALALTASPDLAPDWSFSASAFVYVVPDGRDYVQPTFTADRGWLHLEARYDYEGLQTGSVWIGFNLRVGEAISLQLTPMVGRVFGKTTGVAPGCHVTVDAWRLELYSEAEWVLDLGDVAASFFYSWTELTLTPVDWLRFGLVAQRTRVFVTERDIQRGFLLGVSHEGVALTAHVFNPDDHRPSYVFSVSADF